MDGAIMALAALIVLGYIIFMALQRKDVAPSGAGGISGGANQAGGTITQTGNTSGGKLASRDDTSYRAATMPLPLVGAGNYAADAVDAAWAGARRAITMDMLPQDIKDALELDPTGESLTASQASAYMATVANVQTGTAAQLAADKAAAAKAAMTSYYTRVADFRRAQLAQTNEGTILVNNLGRTVVKTGSNWVAATDAQKKEASGSSTGKVSTTNTSKPAIAGVVTISRASGEVDYQKVGT